MAQVAEQEEITPVCKRQNSSRMNSVDPSDELPGDGHKPLIMSIASWLFLVASSSHPYFSSHRLDCALLAAHVLCHFYIQSLGTHRIIFPIIIPICALLAAQFLCRACSVPLLRLFVLSHILTLTDTFIVFQINIITYLGPLQISAGQCAATKTADTELADEPIPVWTPCSPHRNSPQSRKESPVMSGGAAGMVEARTGKLNFRFKPRYFVLTSTELLWYSSAQHYFSRPDHPDRLLLLRGDAGCANVLVDVEQYPPSAKWPALFYLRSGDNGMWELKWPSMEHATPWVRCQLDFTV